MASIAGSIEIARPPADVFAYVTDAARIPEWQESAVSSEVEGGGPVGPGARVLITRRVGPLTRTMTSEITTHDPPSSFQFRGIDGPVRATVKGSVEPLGDGARSRLTIEIEPEGHGIGKLLVPLVVRRQIAAELPRNLRTAMQRLEAGGEAG